MKATLFALFVALLMTGCGEEGGIKQQLLEEGKKRQEEIKRKYGVIIAEAIEFGYEEHQKAGWIGGLFYASDKDLEPPYTGWVKEVNHKYDSIVKLTQFKDGVQDGPDMSWGLRVMGGYKLEEGTWKDGAKDGLWTYWYGRQKKREETYKDGKLMTAVAWRHNGEKCPVTNVVNGNGVVVRYWTVVASEEEIWSEWRRWTYKDGSVYHNSWRGRIYYNDDGTEKMQTTFKNGKRARD